MGHYAKLIVMAAFAWAGVASAAPRIYCEQPDWDFGTVSDAASVTNVFLIENRGDTRLLISDVKSSCGCATAVLPVKQLAPGAQLTLTVFFDPTKREGRQRKVIRIYSNDSKTPVFNLLVSGRVNPQVITMPSAVTFIAHPSDKIVERTLTLTYDRPVQIQSLKTDLTGVMLESAGSQSSRSHVILVKMDPAQLHGQVRGALKIGSDHPDVPVQIVPLVGRIK